VVFQDNFVEDKLYMIKEYPDFIVEEHQKQVMDTSQGLKRGTSDNEMRQ
jgi:hypothetical protein